MKNNYYLKGVNVQKMWDDGFIGEGVIGILDSGFKQHDYFPSNMILEGRNFTNEGAPNDYTDMNGHGTAVTSIIYSICPKVKIIVAKVVDKNGSGSINSIIEGLKYLISKDVDIISCSLGSPSTNQELTDTIKAAQLKNIPVVCASGNEGDGVFSTDEICYPAYYDYTVEVGAIDNDNVITDFSNSNSEVDVVSYGVRIKVCGLNNNYNLESGTSFSTPIISACMLLLKNRYLKEFRRKPTESEMYAMLIRHTIDLPNTDRYLQGFGRFKF